MRSLNERKGDFQVKVQRNRGLIYVFGLALVVSMSLLGIFDYPLFPLVFLILAGALSAPVFGALGKLLGSSSSQRFLDVAWIVLDAALIGVGVARSGGFTSPWLPWFLAGISGAAFIWGQRAAFGVFLLNATSFAVAMWWFEGVGPRGILQAYGIVGSLYAASFFFLKATVELREQRDLIRVMRSEDQRKVDELTRLTHELESRTQQVYTQSQQLVEGDRVKSQFLANMSHELRTPLNSIIGFSEILMSRLEDKISVKHLKFLANIHGSGKHLLQIINDILDLAKIEAGKATLSPSSIRLASILDSILTVIKGQAAQRRICLEINVDDDFPVFDGDMVKVKQILYNLMSNAVKFSHDGGTVRVEGQLVKPDDSPLGVETIEISVADDGVGIAPEDQDLIFEEFRQADGSSARRFGGAGLGLALVRRFTELHNGSVRVESALGLGSTFSILLPVQLDSVVPVDRMPRPSTGPMPHIARKVLVVEDDPTAWEHLNTELTKADYLPIRARNCEEAILLAKQLKPAAITLDLILPGGDGWTVLKKLKACEDTRSIPVIIVSMVDDRELGLALGADDYFVKPVDGSELKFRLAELLPSGLGDGHPRILIVDDDPMIHDLLEASFPPDGFDLEHAMTGADGVRMTAELKPDLIILDLMMEEMDGFEVAAVLTSDPTTANIPIVVLTAKEMTTQDRERLRGKVAALVEKGEKSSNSLVPIIRNLVQRRQGESTS